jgi:TP901 family phage tail tape measure protein
MEVGVLLAILRLQDEMSPALVDASNRLSTFGSAATSAGLALSAGITAPLSALMYATINAGTEFETVMNQIKGVLTPTASEMELVRQTAMRMGADTMFSASQAATAILELGKAGFSTTEAIGAVDDVLVLAAASGLEMGAAAEFAAKTIQGFGLEALDLAHVNDVLAAAVNQTALDIEDLMVAFGYIGPIATSFSISIEQASAALAIMVSAGVPAETAARSLRDALTDLVNPVGQTVDAMQMLGIETFKTADGALMPFADIISLLESKAMTAGESLMLFGKQSGGPMYELVLKGREALDQLTIGFEQSKGAGQAMADAMMSGLPGAIEFLRGSIDTLFITLSKQLEPTIIAVVNGLNSAADFLTAYVIPAFSALPIPVQALAIGMTALAAAIGPLLLLLGGMAFGVSSLVTLYGTLVPATAVASTSTVVLVSALGILGTALAVAATAITSFVGTLSLLDATGASEYIEYASLRIQQFFGVVDSAATKEDLWNSVLANTARRMGEVDAATANTYQEREKLLGVVNGVTIAELDLNEALGKATGGLNSNADAIRAADAAAASWRQTLNWLGEQYQALDAAQYAYEQHLNLLASSQQVATASTGMAVEQYNNYKTALDTTLPLQYNTIQRAVEQQGVQDALTASLQRSGMAAFDFGAHVDNNASQIAAAIPNLYTLANGYLTLGSVIIDLGSSFGYASDAMSIMAEAFDSEGAQIAANMLQLGSDLVGIWTNPNTGIVDKIITSALAIGAGVADALHQTAAEDIVERVAYDWGVQITEELGKAIEDTANALFGGDRQAAEIFHLTDLLDAAGGLNDANFDTFTARLHDVFSMIETGMFTSAQAITVLSDNWETFVEAGIDGAGRLSPKLVEIMDLTQRFASELGDPALAQQFVDQWVVLVDQLNLGIRENFDLTVSEMFDMFALVAEGVLPIQAAIDAIDQTWDTFVEEGTNKVTGLLDPALQQAILSMRQLGIESEAVTEYIRDQLHSVVEGLNERVAVFGDVIAASLEDGIGSSERLGFVLSELGTDAAGLQSEFSNLGVYTVATFGALISEGYGLREALALIGDSLDALAQAEHVFGLEGSAALEQLLGFRNIVESNQAVFDSLDGLQKMMTGLANTGYLTQEVFSAFGADIATQFERLTANGVSANDALLLMQPNLQTLWELQHNFGFEVDASTQALLDQAEAAGLIGGQFQDVMLQIKDILLAIADALGAQLPDYLRKVGETGEEVFGKLETSVTEFADTTERSLSDIEAQLNALYSGDYSSLGGFDVGGVTYGVGSGVIDTYAEWLKTHPGYDYFNPSGKPIPWDPLPGTGPMTGGCGCGLTVGPVYVMDGTSPSVGSLFVKSLLDELKRGNGMDAFRQLVCEAMTC